MLWKLVENVKYEDIYEVTFPSVCLCLEETDLLDVLLGNNEALDVVKISEVFCRRL